MAKKILIVGVILIAIGGVVFAFTANNKTESPDSVSTGDQMTDMDMDSSSSSGSTGSQQSATDNTSTEQSSGTSVEIKDYAYSPATITVKKGTTVTWTNQDSVRHDITPDEESDAFQGSELLSKGESYSFTFNTAGTYTYHCSPHPYMTAKVIVTE